ncbi:MAG: BT_3044 domain-containing protein, partial [Sphingobacterium sp.]
HRTFVVDEQTLFLYAGLRDIDFLDRKNYKVFIKFTDDKIDLQKKKLEIWSDNSENNKFKVGEQQSYYTIDEAWDAQRPYMKHVYITLYLSYEFEDYTAIPGQRLKYRVEGTLSMQRDLNTLIPDEDQQIQW